MTTHDPNLAADPLLNMATKTSTLTPDDVLKIAHARIIMGVGERELAVIFNTNQGRIAEVTQAMEWAITHHKRIYNHDRSKPNPWVAAAVTATGAIKP